jgi:hypothetical protein
MKKLISIAVLLAMLSVGLFSSALAAGPTGTYVTGIACVNLEATAGSFTIKFYDTTGANTANLSDTITANGSKMYFTPSISQLPSGFMGSAVVESTVELACSVNTQTGSGTLRVGTSNGVTTNNTGTALFVTQIMNNLSGWSTYVAVQNTSASAADITVKYFNSSGTQVFNYTRTGVPANSTHVFYQDGDEDGVGDSDLPAGFIGSATFESTAPLAGAVAMYNAGTGGSDAQFLSYNAVTGGGTKIYGPRLVKNLSGVGYTSGFSCQNVGAVSTDVSAAFTVYDQAAAVWKTATLNKTGLGSKQAWAVYMGSTGNATLDAITKFYGSAIFQSTASNVACTINEDNRTTYAGLGSTYNGIPDGQQSGKIFFSQIVALGAASYRGGFQVANTTATAATCTYTFSNGDVISGVALAANGSLSVFAESVLLHNQTNFNGSAVVECTQPIVGIYNLANTTVPGDSFATNSGINQAP